MGTSRARRAPTRKQWQAAKRAMTRFASPGGGGPAAAAEVLAKYCLAVQDDPVSDLPESPSTIPTLERTAQKLADFYTFWGRHGLALTLKAFGVAGRPGEVQEAFLAALSETLAGPGAELEEAVGRAACVDFLSMEVQNGDLGRAGTVDRKPSSADVRWKIKEFIALAIHRKLMSDLGESLEGRAADANIVRRRERELEKCIREPGGTTSGPDFELTWPAARRREWVKAQVQQALSGWDERHGD